MRPRLLARALDHVPTYGWTRKALEAAAVDLQLPSTAHGLVRGGETDLVAYFVRECNAKLADRVGPLGELTMRDRLQRACRVRLELVAPHHATWAEALAVLAAPYNVPVAARLLGETSDEILAVCGDSSVDTWWYGKRAGVGAAYGAAELFWLTDVEPDKAPTWAFLQSAVDTYISAVQATTSISKLMAHRT